jgi:hypothetical protein
MLIYLMLEYANETIYAMREESDKLYNLVGGLTTGEGLVLVASFDVVNLSRQSVHPSSFIFLARDDSQYP